MRALLTEKSDTGHVTSIRDVPDDQLGEGDVTVRIEWSTVNYKDALAVSGHGDIMKVFPLVGGIDLAGTVETSNNAAYRPGDRVLVNGWGLSQTHNGGYAEKARLPAEWLIPVPDAFTTREAMGIGTAGYTAMMCVMALENAGVKPTSGDVLVTGANGGVGSIAISLLSKLGYRVIASTGRPEEADYLHALGATELIDRNELSAPGRPIGRERWAGAVDSVGSHTLANVLAQTRYRGAVAACGLAQGMDLPGSMAPFILRNVSLLGIDSVNTPKAVRERAWARLTVDLDPAKLLAATREITLDEVPSVTTQMLQGKGKGRVVVRIAP